MPLTTIIGVTASAAAVAAGTAPSQDRQLSRLVFEFVRPYWGWLLIVFIAMLVEIAMSLAAPWPLKIVLDDALGNHKLPEWLAWAHDYGFRRNTLGVALFAGLATLFIAVIGAIATYIDNYYNHECGPVGGQRPTHSHLRTPPPIVASLLRQRQDRGVDVNDDHRRCYAAEFRFIIDVEHPRGHDYHYLYGRADVLA